MLAFVLTFALLAAACGGSDTASSSETSSSSGSAESSEQAADPADQADEAEEPAAPEETASADEESAGAAAEASDGDRVQVRWFVGLGTGAQDEQIAAQEAVVDTFNASQNNITLVAEYVDNATAKDVLATQIAAGNAPDIIGPVGLEGSNAFAGQYADLEPLIASSGFDLSPYGESAEVYRTAEGVLEGIPFATFPSAIFYNTELFDEAGLPYPPASYGADGTAMYGEGTEFEGVWDWDKVAEISQILTVDTNGEDATSGAFDSENIIQFGFGHQWTSNPTSMGTSFGAGQVEQPDGSAAIPAAWVDSYKWYHNMVHDLHAAPTDAQMQSDLLGGNIFNSGNVAMVSTHLWYTCCLADEDGNQRDFWDLGALPSNDGVVVSKLHGDNFRIHKDSDNQDAAFEVLSYFGTDAMLDLLNVYGGMPARADIRDQYFAGLDEQFPQGVNWDVIIAGLDYPDAPNHQISMPSFLEADARIKEFEQPLLTDPDLDIDAAIAQLEADLTSLWAN